MELIIAESSLELSSDHTPTIVMLLSPQEIVSPTGNLAISGKRINWLKYKKYLSTHCTENISLGSPEEIDLSFNNFDRNLKLAAETDIHPE